MKFSHKLIIIISIVFTYSLILSAQEDEKKEPVYGWQNLVIGNLNFTQNSFENWAAGGENSWAWQLDFSGNFTNDQQDFNWANSAKLSFGQAKVGDIGSRKAADEIKLESVYTYKLNDYLNPYAAATAQTQFVKGYAYTTDSKTAISDIFDPAYFTQSIGVGYKPNEIIKTRAGAALKETITNKHAEIYSNGEKNRVELGAESVTDLNMQLSESILYTSKLELFSTLNAINEVDVNWDNVFAAKVSDYIKVTFNFKLFYDRDISPKRQLKQTLGAGLSYSFM